METEHKLPLGLFKQACMKLDAFLADVHEIREDESLDEENKETLTRMIEIAGVMEANLINIVKKEMNEEDFLNEKIEMDQIDEYPEEDILNSPVG